MNSKKGYSLIEIAVGLVIIVIFLFCTGSLINASFTNYRLVLQRSEALDMAIEEMENVLQSDDVTLGNVGHETDTMKSRVTIEKIKDGNKVYDDKIYLVTVRVEYSKTPRSAQKNSIELQSLKVMK